MCVLDQGLDAVIIIYEVGQAETQAGQDRTDAGQKSCYFRGKDTITML